MSGAASSVDGCCSACAADPSCSAFVEYLGICYLKGGEVTLGTLSGRTTYLKLSSPSRPPPPLKPPLPPKPHPPPPAPPLVPGMEPPPPMPRASPIFAALKSRTSANYAAFEHSLDIFSLSQLLKATGMSDSWLDRLAHRSNGFADSNYIDGKYRAGGRCSSNRFWEQDHTVPVDTQTWNMLTMTGSTLQPQATFVERKRISLHVAAKDMVISEEWTASGNTYKGTLRALKHTHNCTYSIVHHAKLCNPFFAGTIFSIGGSGIQWENTGSGFLAFEWFLRYVFDGPSVTSQIDCNANPEVCVIAQSRDELKASMLSFVKDRSLLLQSTNNEHYQGVSGSLRAEGAPTGLGYATSKPRSCSPMLIVTSAIRRYLSLRMSPSLQVVVP